MKFFDRIKASTAVSRLLEEKMYKTVLDELSDGIRRDGLWAKALAKSNGNDGKAKSLYIEYRVQSIKDETEITKVNQEILNGNEKKYQEISEEAERRYQEKEEEIATEHIVSMIEKGDSVDKVNQFFDGLNASKISVIINQSDACGEYPLHVAIKHNRIDIAELLLQSGANTNAKNDWEETPLDIAVRRENLAAQEVIQKYLT